MPDITLNTPAYVDSKMRFPTDGVLTVSDAEADRVRAAGFTVEPDGLDAMTVAELHEQADLDHVDLQGVTLKADIIATIRAHRAALAALPAFEPVADQPADDA